MIKIYHLFSIIFLIGCCAISNAQQIAFPGAEGYGQYTTGGRGGAVYEVTNLSDAGAGSLRYGVESTTRPLTIVFRVSGTIELVKDLRIKTGNLTIAGQTAPGDGICIRNSKLIVPAGAVSAVTTIASFSVNVEADNVIIRYIRFRPGDEFDNIVGAPIANIKFENDGLTGRRQKNIIIDHCSMSWAIDEVSSFYDNTNFTMQWCLIGESLYHSYHPKGDHGYGGIWGGMGATFHHNLIADNTSRNPRFCGARYHCVFPQTGCGVTLPASTEIVDYRNNVIYNWAGNSAYGGEGGQQNMINNYYKQGPGTAKKGGSQRYRIVSPSVSTDPKVDSASKWYITGNYMNGYPAVTDNNAHGTGFQPDNTDSVAGLWARMTTPFPFASVTSQTAQDAYASVLDSCGASLHRDSVDRRIIYQARTGTATTGGLFGANTGIIDSPSQVGGWPQLNSTIPPVDTDHDGMPDVWELAHGLNSNDATDRNTLGTDGYTMLEKYINSLTKPITQYTLTTTVLGSGKVSPANGSYDASTRVLMIASPSPGWRFDSWSGDTTSNEDTIAMSMIKNKNITATFSAVTYALTLNTVGSGALEVTPSASLYSYGSKVTLIAKPNPGYKFDGWSGDTTGINDTTTVTMTNHKTITANFSVQTSVERLTFPGEATIDCYPNPVSGNAKLVFNVPSAGNVNISLFNTLGEQIGEITNRKYEAGEYEKKFDTSHLQPGIYLYAFTIGGKRIVKRLTVVR